MLRCLFALYAVALLQSAAAVFIPYEDRPRTEDLRPEGRSYLQISSTEWPAWVAKRDAEIRGRLARGDEDSLVYLWLYGTSFTKQPRATVEHLSTIGTGEKAEALLIQRLEDLVAGVRSPEANERLQFARTFLTGKGMNPATAAGRDHIKAFLVTARERVIAENQQLVRSAQSARQSADPGAAMSAYATLYRERGLSSDTRLTSSFAVDATLAALAQGRVLGAGSVRRAAIVGPGLDFTDKAEGFDFYPQQTIQPFALFDSLLRLALAKPGELRVSTFDLSPRVNAHLANAVRRAAAATAYRLQLPRPLSDPRHEWQPELIEYWRSFGERLGRTVAPAAVPPGMSGIELRAISVTPSIVSAIAPHDLNVVVQRQQLAERERFDLIVATNILVYYDAFEQSLALANIASMLRPGGIFLANYAVAPSAQMEALPQLTTPVFFDKQQNGDTIYCYRRR